ncbi:hypothetical protein [Rurimicrobium arvi]|uniref:Lipoprotein n=1 Tax=Rurimicrobium arvi TaxID=2049916 RepID=A0ABP8MFA9_9BACT
MNRLRFLLPGVILFVVVLTSCQRRSCPLTNTGDNTETATNEQLGELWKAMQQEGLQRLHYEVAAYQEEGGTPGMKVLVSGSGVCNYLDLDLSSSDLSLKDIRNAQGKGYHGAELRHPVIVADSSSGQWRFRLLSVVAVAD